MDDFNSKQLITLGLVFVGFHALALPALIWGMRRRQFAGREQKEWNLSGEASPDTPLALLPPAALNKKARAMLTILGVLAALMLASVALVVYVALYGTAHAVTGQSPY